MMLIQLFIISSFSLTSFLEQHSAQATAFTTTTNPIGRQRHQNATHQRFAHPHLNDDVDVAAIAAAHAPKAAATPVDNRRAGSLSEPYKISRGNIVDDTLIYDQRDKIRAVRSSSVSELSPDDANGRLKVAALATKLEHWLKCYRNNLSTVQQQHQRQRTQIDPTSSNQSIHSLLTITGTTTTTTTTTAVIHPFESSSERTSNQHQQEQPQEEPEPIICPSHYDGHLCWPETRAGQQIRLACPQINLLFAPRPNKVEFLSSSNPLVTATTTNQPQHIPNSVIATTIHQQHQSRNLDGNGQSATAPTTSTTSAPISGPTTAAADAAANPQQLKFGRRTCGTGPPGDTADGGQLAGQWLGPADYSDCGERAGNLFDPTDELVALNDGAGLELDRSDRELFTNLQRQLERIEPSIDPYTDPDLLDQWTQCIGEIMTRHRAQAAAAAAATAAATANGSGPQPDATGGAGRNNRGAPNSSTGYCPIIFDGWRCWPATEAGEIAYTNCPKNQPGFSAERKAYKICTRQADWYRHPETDRYWSNYTTCVDTVDLAFRTKILNLYVIGNLISLIALAVSLIIFVSFKSLNCTRVTIHKNLFLSFITNNLMWIIWYTCVVNDAGLLQANPLGCRLWHILLHYFLVSNYFWMFCEGLYLHTLLVVTFVSEDRILKWFYLLGWLTPVPIVVTYAHNRSYDEYYTNFCWMEESPHNVILMAPIGFSLLLNLIFLINIVRVLVTKLRANNSPDAHQTRKAVRATLILIPLLGLHYMLTPFRPEAKSEWEIYYEIIAAVCTSFQGLCVAMLFCFCNGEVLQAIKKRLKDSILFNRDSKRTMRSRSNTAISNVFNSVATGHGNSSSGNNNNNNNNISTNQRRYFDMPRSAFSSSSTSSSSAAANLGNLITNQLQRQSLIANEIKPNGKSATNGDSDAFSQRPSVMTTVTEVSPLQQHHNHHFNQHGHHSAPKCPSPIESTTETKLIFEQESPPSPSSPLTAG